MNSNDSVPPIEPVMEMIHEELSTMRRWILRLFLVVVSVVTAAILSLWITEARPLPPRRVVNEVTHPASA